MRDSEVDKLIHQANLAYDQLADATDVDHDSVSKGRVKNFAAAKVSTIIEITHPAFVTAEGVRVDDAKVKVISTPKRFSAVYEPPKPSRVEHERPVLEEFNVKWMRMGKADVLYCRYYDADGKWKRHTVNPDTTTGDPELYAALVKHHAKHVQLFYDEHHKAECLAVDQRIGSAVGEDE